VLHRGMCCLVCSSKTSSSMVAWLPSSLHRWARGGGGGGAGTATQAAGHAGTCCSVASSKSSSSGVAVGGEGPAAASWHMLFRIVFSRDDGGMVLLVRQSVLLE
jgi:hypothetical protein